MPSTIDIGIYACEICGLMMVAGALWLLRIGVIKLSEAAKGAVGLTVELEQKIKEVERKLKISTSYPTIALFIIGFCFIAYGVWSARHAIQTYNIVGNLPISDTTGVTVMVAPEPGNITPDSSGKLDRFVNFDPDFRRVIVLVNSPGYEPTQHYFYLEAKDRRVQLPDHLVFTKLQSAPSAPGSIVPVPANTVLAPFGKPPNF